MTRPGRAAAAGILLLALGGPRGTPAAHPKRLPWSIRIEVFYGNERNRAEYPEELQRRIAQAVIACEAYASVGSAGDEDLVASVVIDLLDVSEDKEFRGPATGGPGEFVKLGASVEIAGDISAVTAGGTVVMPPKKFHHVSRSAPVAIGDDPVPRAIAAAFEDVVGWSRKYLCREREQIRKVVEQSGEFDPKPSAP